MALYLVERTDNEFDYDPSNGDAPEFTAAVVRAKGRLQARKEITRGGDVPPFPGVKADGSNLRVSRVQEGRDLDNRVILVTY